MLSLDGDGRRYVVSPSGDLEPLPEVANEMYRLGSGASTRIPVQAAQIAQLQVRPSVRAAGLARPPPTGLEHPLRHAHRRPGRPAEVALLDRRDAPRRRARPHGRRHRLRRPGAGRQGQVLGKGPVLAIDQTATAYAVEGADAEVLARLGYAPDDVVPVPQAWTELFRSGPALGTAAARTVVSGGS